jgi:hypothetical protein
MNACYVEIQFPLRHFVYSKSYKMTNKNEAEIAYNIPVFIFTCMLQYHENISC